jgi:alanine racemase
MRSRAIRATRVEIDCGAILANADALHRLAGVPLFAVVKADAYGHGAVPVARALAGRPGVAGLAVALVEEGRELREAGIGGTLLMLGACLGDGHAEVVARDLLPVVARAEDLGRFAALGRARGRPVEVHIKVDTGMSRLGLGAGEVGAAVGAALAQGGVAITGLCTHFACADTDDPADPACMTAVQLRRFDEVLAALRAAGAAPTCLHAANGAAAIGFARARLSCVRPGIALYGNAPAPAGVTLRQAMRLCTDIVALRDLAAGAQVSYGAKWRAPAPARVAVLPIGYADGYPHRLTRRAQVLIGGQRCPVVGAVCMDMTMVDVTALGDAVRIGDEVVVLGSQGLAHITTAELAAWADLLPYEVTCGISKRVPRVYG